MLLAVVLIVELPMSKEEVLLRPNVFDVLSKVIAAVPFADPESLNWI